jgi:two-component system OmpR family sensor kinase
MEGNAGMDRTWLGRYTALAACAGVLSGSAHLAPTAERTIVCVMAMLSVAGMAMVSILAHVAGRLADRRVGWISPLAALYGVLAVPAVLGIDVTHHIESATDRVLLTGALLLAVLGLLAGLAVAWTGQVEVNPTLGRLGLAVVAIAVAHGYHVGVADAPGHDFVFASVRLAGVLMLLVATVRCTHRAILRVKLEQSEQRAQLRLAQLELSQAAERDHEVRNAVAGLAGAVTLIDTRPSVGETATLRTAVVAELARLDVLLSGPAQPEPERSIYRVRPVLCQQVALRRSAGMEIGLDAELGLGAVGSSSLLAQVLTNVLSNCASHATGSPVWIEARRDGDHIRIRVSDLGPGIAVQPGCDVFESGVRGERSDGRGLGLHISRRLLAAEGGTITIRPRSVDQPGCTVELKVMAAEVTQRPDDLLVLRRAS